MWGGGDPRLCHPASMISSRPVGCLRFDRVGKVFPDGTRAVDDASLEVGAARWSPSSARPVAASRRCCASPPASTEPTAGDDHAAPATSATCSRTRRCCRGARCSATSSCSPSSAAVAPLSALDWPPKAIELTGLHRLRAPPPARALRRHADAGVARPGAHAAAAVFLFDEPFGALDEITRERLNDELRPVRARAVRRSCSSPTRSARPCTSPRACLVMSPRPGRIVAETRCRSPTRARPNCASIPSSPPSPAAVSAPACGR